MSDSIGSADPKPPSIDRLSAIWRRINQHKVVQWYLFQQEISPWRVWHFRIPPRLQEWLTHKPVPPPSQGWTLYRRSGMQWVKVDVPHVANWPRRVPGL